MPLRFFQILVKNPHFFAKIHAFPPHTLREILNFSYFSQFDVDKLKSLCYILITILEVLLLAKTLEYKGHPLQRKDNIIYYGSFDYK